MLLYLCILFEYILLPQFHQQLCIGLPFNMSNLRLYVPTPLLSYAPTELYINQEKVQVQVLDCIPSPLWTDLPAASLGNGALFPAGSLDSETHLVSYFWTTCET